MISTSNPESPSPQTCTKKSNSIYAYSTNIKSILAKEQPERMVLPFSKKTRNLMKIRLDSLERSSAFSNSSSLGKSSQLNNFQNGSSIFLTPEYQAKSKNFFPSSKH